MYNFKNKMAYKFIYQSSPELLNNLAIYKDGLNPFSKELDDFLEFCEFHKISYLNFLNEHENYVFTDSEVKTVQFDIDLKYGISFKHLLDTYGDKYFDFSDVYNFEYDGSIITYSYLEEDFLKDHDTVFENEIELTLDRVSEYRLRDYINLNYYNFQIEMTKVDGKILLKTDDCNNVWNVYTDFIYFDNTNVLECRKCKKLVENAFEDYTVQNHLHDWCK